MTTSALVVQSKIRNAFKCSFSMLPWVVFVFWFTQLTWICAKNLNVSTVSNAFLTQRNQNWLWVGSFWLQIFLATFPQHDFTVLRAKWKQSSKSKNRKFSSPRGFGSFILCSHSMTPNPLCFGVNLAVRCAYSIYDFFVGSRKYSRL
jgi:hypothetical protein